MYSVYVCFEVYTASKIVVLKSLQDAAIYYFFCCICDIYKVYTCDVGALESIHCDNHIHENIIIR